jgi:hypothetical protein
MTNFLFWNLNNKPLQEVIANLAHKYDIDVLMFVECDISVYDILTSLNSGPLVMYNYVPKIGCDKVELFVKFPPEFIQAIYETSRLTIRRLQLPASVEVLLAITHYPSKLSWSDDSQAAGCTELALEIQMQEKKVGHSRTVLVGDLNMNPFEDGVVNSMGLHGVMNRNIAAKNTRVVNEKEYTYFYNPMWNYFGDTNTPPGTYFYYKSEPKTYFWNIFDQVLIRPELLSRFDTNEMQILTSDGNISFLNDQGLPDTRLASDHLPLLFKISL